MHGNQWVLKIAVLKYYSVSKRGTTAKSNPKQATDPISLHTKFGDNSSNTFPLNERKPCVMPDIRRRTAEKAKIIYPPPRGVDIIHLILPSCRCKKCFVLPTLFVTSQHPYLDSCDCKVCDSVGHPILQFVLYGCSTNQSHVLLYLLIYLRKLVLPIFQRCTTNKIH